ncbi:DUF4166 domain-containing protein [Microbacterium sp. H1-D42]|uniref:DUF4166 domain-containing protein n=1 Tax=Microbacterium sp. H1-D42 TaxID=2925844 RepID=UPI001F53989F|nr:DUF4166 domain-containing protein [Microbacterium sp. H1-D42]UNK71856.1 DUF4166 domain-containing protein [Microbacterium sp. H1-D42]
MEHVPQSPYLRALGGQRSQLHPALRTYFSAVPRGKVGIGEGVFEKVGTPRRWLWPVLRHLQRFGVVYAGWQQDVPFTIRNLGVASRSISERTLHLSAGDWTMRDSVSAGSHGRVLDQLGEPVTLAVVFDVSVDGDALALRSRSVGLRVGRLRVRIPRLIAPVVRLRESAEKQAGRQRVSLTVDAPLLGRLYEYQGVFTYRLESAS